jgi:cytochrome oxidase Cu insertion factor (SCO1/SenC/PrrC family)
MITRALVLLYAAALRASLFAALPGCSPSVNEAAAQSPASASLAVASAPAGTGFSALDLPAPGTYVLDRIMQTPSASVLDSDGSMQPLRRFLTGKVTLFAFIYTACSDARGCPLALATMHALKAAIAQDPRLREQVRFVSMSFDPAYDTPQAMRSYGGIDARPDARPRWHFLTSRSARELNPVLRGFGQDVRASDVEAASGGAMTARAPLEHLLKIYLVDQQGTVREIYSPAFLQASAMLTDIRSLVRE